MSRKHNKRKKNEVINPLFILTKNQLLTKQVKDFELARFYRSHLNMLEGHTDNHSWSLLADMMHLSRCLSDISGNNKDLFTEVYDDISLDMSNIYDRANDKSHKNYIGKFVYQSNIVSKVNELICLFQIDLETATQGNIYDAYVKLNLDILKEKVKNATNEI
jgi:hypothetical protein